MRCSCGIATCCASPLNVEITGWAGLGHSQMQANLDVSRISVVLARGQFCKMLRLEIQEKTNAKEEQIPAPGCCGADVCPKAKSGWLQLFERLERFLAALLGGFLEPFPGFVYVFVHTFARGIELAELALRF